MRDIERQVQRRPSVNHIFRRMLFLAGRVHAQERGQRGLTTNLIMANARAPEQAQTADVYVSEQKRGVTRAIKRELKRRAAVEPVIGHLKSDHRMDRNYLIGSHGDAANAVLAAVGYNFARLLGWLRQLLCALLSLLTTARSHRTPALSIYAG